MRRGLHGVDKCLAGTTALEASKFFGGNDDDVIAAMNGDGKPLTAPASIFIGVTLLCLELVDSR